MPASARRSLLMIASIARLLNGLRHVAVGAKSPIPAAGALLAQHQSGGRMQVSILGDDKKTTFTDGNRELFDCAAQGRIDAFFLSGAQIDKDGNVNLLGLGSPRQLHRRFMGSFGAPYMAMMVPNVILFQMDHSPRTLVDKVDFVTAPGTNAPGVFRRGQADWLITNRCLFRRSTNGFRLNRVHPPETLSSVQAQTGFQIIADDDFNVSEMPSSNDQLVISGPIRDMVVDLYPDAVTLFDDA